RLDGAAAEQELRRAAALRNGARVAPVARRTAAPPAARLIVAEKWLLDLLLQEDPEVAAALAELQESDLEGLRSSVILRAAKSLHLKGERVTAANLSEALPDDQRRVLREIAMGAAVAE